MDPDAPTQFITAAKPVRYYGRKELVRTRGSTDSEEWKVSVDLYDTKNVAADPLDPAKPGWIETKKDIQARLQVGAKKISLVGQKLTVSVGWSWPCRDGCLAASRERGHGVAGTAVWRRAESVATGARRPTAVRACVWGAPAHRLSVAAQQLSTLSSGRR